MLDSAILSLIIAQKALFFFRNAELAITDEAVAAMRFVFQGLIDVYLTVGIWLLVTITVSRSIPITLQKLPFMPLFIVRVLKSYYQLDAYVYISRQKLHSI
jgi:hypothetical protein